MVPPTTSVVASPMEQPSLDADSPFVPVDPPSSGSSPSVSDLDLPITLRKGTCCCTTLHPISHFVKYNFLSPGYSVFVSSLSFVSLPHSVPDALSHPRWRDAMVEEMSALHSNGTWDLVPLPKGNVHC